MKGRVRVIGHTPSLQALFATAIEECGYEAVLSEKDEEGGVQALVIEAAGGDDLRRILEFAPGRPFLIFASTDAQIGMESVLIAAGCAGVIRENSTAEETAFLLNKAVRAGTRKPRATVSFPVLVASDGGVIRADAAQLSRDGIFIVTLNPLPVDTRVELEFMLPGVDMVFKTRARVLYILAINPELNIIVNPASPYARQVSHPGMAALFTDMPEHEKAVIDRYIERLALL